MPTRVLLGPQRPRINLTSAFSRIDDDGPVAVISAGWQHSEGELDIVGETLQRPLFDLGLYQHAEALFATDRTLHTKYRERQEQLIELQRLYRLRLRAGMRAARSLLRAEGDGELLRQERRHAIHQVRELDAHHAKRIAAINQGFSDFLDATPSSLLSELRQEISETLSNASSVLVAGGNVAVLLNRLRLFEVGPCLADKHVVAWSAGAMALSDQLVLFHDNTPGGYRDAELFESGLGLVTGLIVFPDAKHRLRLKDRTRVALLARRFAPATCTMLDSGSMICQQDGRLVEVEDVRCASGRGSLRKFAP